MQFELFRAVRPVVGKVVANTSDQARLTPKFACADAPLGGLCQKVRFLARVAILGMALIIFASSAVSEINVPLQGRTVRKFLPDATLPLMYALNPGSGLGPGTLFTLSTTNGVILKEITVNTNPTDMVINRAGDTLYVINAGSRTIMKVNLTSFTVVSEKSISTPYTYAVDGPLHLAIDASGVLYYTDAAKAPNIYLFDYVTGTNKLVYGGGAYSSYGAGGMAVSPTLSNVLYIFDRYGWNWYIYSTIKSLAFQGGKFVETASHTEYDQDAGDYFEPILVDSLGRAVFHKMQMVSADNVTTLLHLFSENINAISSDGGLAFGPTKMFDTTNGTVVCVMPSRSYVQAVAGNQNKLFRFNVMTTNVTIYDLASLQGPTVTQQPTNQTVNSGNPLTLSVGAIGLSPLYYHWYANGVNFATTTNGSVTIKKTQTADAGTFSVIVSNAFGTALSSNFTVVVTNTAPTILAQPASQVVPYASNAVFSVQASGSEPLSYQWRFGGVNLRNATNETLAISNVQLTNQGNYDVVVSNAFGSLASSEVHLTVVNMNAALNTTNLSWTTGGDVPWFVQVSPGSPVTHDGFASMQSGNVGAVEQSKLQTTINGPATVTFWWKAESLSDWDTLTLSVNDIQQSQLSGRAVWNQQTVYLGAGANLLEWNYTRDFTYGKAAAWVDEVGITPGGTAPFTTRVQPSPTGFFTSNTTMSVTLAGTPPINYQWKLDGADIAGATNAVLALSNLQQTNKGIYSVVAKNDFGTTNIVLGYLDVVDLAQSLNATNLSWSTTGNASWFPQGSVNHDGIAAAQNRAINIGQQSILQTTVQGPGLLIFWWNVNSETENDCLMFAVNGAEQGRIFGYPDWQQQTVHLGAGPQVLQWTLTNSDWYCSGWLDQVTYIPGATPPFITLTPTNQVAVLGSTATLNAGASGTPPLSYQWQLNGINIDQATNISLTVPDAQFTNEGNYTFVAKSPFGATNSAPAYLNVVDFAETLDATNLTWSSSGNQPWFAQTATTHDGAAALQSGLIGDNQQSTFSTTVSGPGTLSFWWKVSSETNKDNLNFSLDGAEQSRISGAVDWQMKTFYLTAGSHLLVWSYCKNATLSSETDAGWLDQISYLPGGSAASAASGPASQVAALSSSVTLSVVAQGTPPITYQWYLNNAAIPGATNATLTIPSVQSANAGAYSVYLHNDYGGSTSPEGLLRLVNVCAWGAGKTNTGLSPDYGQCLVSTNLSGVTALAGGGYHTLALSSNGLVTSWGMNNYTYGQTNVPPGLTNVIAVSAGFSHSLTLTSNGTVSAWGNNSYGQTSVPAAATNITAVAAGWYHNLALRTDGTVTAWGAGSWSSPGFLPYQGQILVPPNLTGVSAIAAGAYHSMALRSNGTVVAWGCNTSGQTNVPAGLSDVIAIAAGGSNSIALKRNGTLVCWGANDRGQANIPAGLSNVVAIAAGAAHVLALKNDGMVVAWGLNANGQTNVPTNLTNVMAVAAGAYHSLALANDGPLFLMAQPMSQTIYKGSNATLTVTCFGKGPLDFQWLKDGAILAGETNASFTISNAQFSDTGNYRVAISNVFGAVTSSVAVLTVKNFSPWFITPPADSVILQNSTLTMSPAVGGIPPLAYQWFFNGAAINSATNSSFVVSNAQPVNQGFYSLTVSNAFGTASSSNAFLDVVDVPQALKATNLMWINPYAAGWFAEDTNTHDGFAAAACSIAYGQQIPLQSYVAGPGKLTFWWLADGSPYFSSGATMSFDIDGVLQASRSGSGWNQYTFYVPSSIHKLTWTAVGSWYFNSTNTVFLSEVTFTPGATPVSLVSQPVSQTISAGSNVTFNVSAVGTPPFNYQWYFNGSAIPGATAASLALSNVQATNGGTYKVSVSNSVNVAISTNAVLTITPSKPVFTSQPAGGAVMRGGSFTLKAGVVGTSPIYYQWLLNGVAVPGATNSSLTLSNVQSAAAGSYVLLASNAVGTVLSLSASLSAYSASDFTSVLNSPGLAWTTADVPWFPQSATNHDGVSAAQSGVITDNQQSTLQTTVTGPAMVVYWWKVDCDSFWDSLAFSANGTILNSISGSIDWQQATNYIGSGTQVLQWKLYPVHGSYAGGTAWLDQVQVIPVAGTGVVITALSGGPTANAGDSTTFSVTATGTPTLRYQWQFNGTNLAGATDSTLTLTNVQANNAGTYAVVVSNDYNFAVSSNLTLAVTPAAPVITVQPVSQTNTVSGSTVLSVNAKGALPLSYQWYFNGSAISGANSNTLALFPLQTGNAGTYWVVVSNAVQSAISSNATVTVVATGVLEFWPYYSKGYSAPLNLSKLTSIAVGATHTMGLRADGTVLVWGDNTLGQADVPPGLSNVIAIAAGDYHCLALQADGTVAAWGYQGDGAGSVPFGLSNVVAIAAGPAYNLALKADGTVAGWGENGSGQTDIPAGLANVQSISAGRYNGFAWTADGTLVQWGNGPVWQHNGTNTNLQFDGCASNVVAMAAGGFSTWWLQNDGSVLASGWFDGVAPYTNTYGGLTQWSANARQRNVYYDVAAVAAYGSSSPVNDYVLLLGNDGRVTQVGVSGMSYSSLVPYVSISPTYPTPVSPANVVAVAAGRAHAAALISDGSPHISWPSFSRAAFTGDTVIFSASASGKPPFRYQWQFNGQNLDFATNATLVLTNVPMSAAGTYRCVVTNDVGTATSMEALLGVNRSTLRFSGGLTRSEDGVVVKLDRLSGHGVIVIQASTNLRDWVSIQTNPPTTGAFHFLDSSATNSPARFYRAIEQ